MSQDLSPSRAANETGLARSLIYREIERGHLRADKVGGRLRITQDALADWNRLHAVAAVPHALPYEHSRELRKARGGENFGAELSPIREEQAA